jgi:DNA-binding transcriptional MerR regulator
MTNTFIGIREVANRLGVKWYRVKYAHMAGLVPEPMRVGNHRLYDEVDVRRLELYFSRKGGNENIQHEREDLSRMEER